MSTLQPTFLLKFALLQLPSNDELTHSLVSNRNGGFNSSPFTLHVTGHVPFTQGVSIPIQK